jgi:SprT protein
MSLLGFLPEPAIPMVDQWLRAFEVQLNVVEPRKTKHGDCRIWRNSGKIIITVNQSPNIYRNLLITVHELAHARVFRDSALASPKPHGKEWKHAFAEMMMQITSLHVFPYDVEIAIERHFRSPRYTADVDQAFSLILKQYDRG